MNYILPNFFDSFSQNQEIISNFMLYFDIHMIQGTFPFNIFNGECNNIVNETLALYPDIKACPEDYRNIGNAILLDYGSTLIEKKDYHNNFGKVIFEEYANNTKFYFEIALENFIDYLIKTYPNIQIILHQNYINNHTQEEIINLIKKYHNIKGIIVTELNPCIDIDNIKKFYLLQLNKCERCKQYNACLKYEMEHTLRYSNQSNFNGCEYTILKSVEELLEEKEYVENVLQYDNILFSTIPLIKEAEYYELIFNFFIKEIEQQKEVKNND